jgi:hypothetical protein
MYRGTSRLWDSNLVQWPEAIGILFSQEGRACHSALGSCPDFQVLSRPGCMPGDLSEASKTLILLSLCLV